MEKKKCIDDNEERQDTLDGLMHGRRGNKVVLLYRNNNAIIGSSLQMAYEKNNEIVIEINHCLAFRKFAK